MLASGRMMAVRATILGLAQLGERLAGSQKVIGSSPLSSTWGCSHAPSPVNPGFSGLLRLAEP